MLTLHLMTTSALIIAASLGPAGPTSPSSQRAAQVETQLDNLARQAHDGAKTHQAMQMARRYYKAQPKSYTAAWHLARAAFFLSHGHAAESEREPLAWEGYQAGLQATRLHPNGVQGHYWAGCALGEYAQAAGIAKSVYKGVGGKIERLFARAVDLDPSYNFAGPLEALGRYYFALPWPLRDLERSRVLLARATQLHPNEIRAQAYLADTLAALDREDEARRHYLACSRVIVNQEIEIDGPRWKDHCQQQLQK